MERNLLYFIRYCILGALFLFLVGCGTKQEITYTPPPSKQQQQCTPPVTQQPSPVPVIKNPQAMHEATMRPYSVNGVQYQPTVVKVGTKYRGIASWYGPDFDGNKTSSGEAYNMHDFTAAHRTLPMNTILKVTNLNNGKSVVVRVNDRGPFVKDRIIDLSYGAAKKLGMLDTGTAPVEIEVLGFDNYISSLQGVPKPKVTLQNFAVQIGAFKHYRGAKIMQEANALVDGKYRAVIKKSMRGNQPLYRVWLTGFSSEAEAEDFLARHRDHYRGAFIVVGNTQ